MNMLLRMVCRHHLGQCCTYGPGRWWCRNFKGRQGKATGRQREGRGGEEKMFRSNWAAFHLAGSNHPFLTTNSACECTPLTSYASFTSYSCDNHKCYYYTKENNNVQFMGWWWYSHLIESSILYGQDYGCPFSLARIWTSNHRHTCGQAHSMHLKSLLCLNP
jgi:hypothetical protein